MTQQPASTDDTNAIAAARIPDDRAVLSSDQVSVRIKHDPTTTKLEEDGKFLRRNSGTEVAAHQDAEQEEIDIILPPSIPEQHKNVSGSVSATSSGHNNSHKLITMVGGNDVHDDNLINAPPSNNNVHVVEGSVAFQQNQHINRPDINVSGEVITTTGSTGVGQGLPSTTSTTAASTTNSTPAADDAVQDINSSTTSDVTASNTNDASAAGAGAGSLATLTKSVSGRRTFPTKLFDILARDDLSHIISWLPHGRSWKVHDQDEFENKVMPVYFQQTKFASFARQVTGWGFKRITAGGPDRNSYFHELFLRDEPRLHITMKRPVKKRQVEMLPGSSDPDFYSLAALPGGAAAMHHHHAAMAATTQHHAGMAAAAHHRNAAAQAHSPYGNAASAAGPHPAQQHLNLYAAAAASQPSAAHAHLGLTTTRGAALAGAYGNELLGAASLDPYGCMGMQLVHAPSAAAAYAPRVSATAPSPYGRLGAAAAGLLNTAQVGADGRLQLLDNVNVNVNSHHTSPHQAAYANMLSAGAAAGLSAAQMGAHLASFAPPAAVASSSTAAAAAAADQHHSYHAHGAGTGAASSGMQRFLNPQHQQQQQHPPPS